MRVQKLVIKLNSGSLFKFRTAELFQGEKETKVITQSSELTFRTQDIEYLVHEK